MKNNYIGWKNVFCFSLVQGVKEKSYRWLLIITCVILIFSVPVKALFDNRNKQEELPSEITVFTVYDDTGLMIDYGQSLDQSRYENVDIVTSPEISFEEHTKKLEESHNSTELIVHITYEESGYFNLTFVKAGNSDLSDDDADRASEDFQNFFVKAKLNATDVTEEQLAFLNREVNISVESASETGEIITDEQEGEGISFTEYFILLGGITIITFIISFSGGNIATSIVTEKSTKVVEYLMINIRPMALLTGKILAALLLVIIEFAAMGISYVLSLLIKNMIFGGGETQESAVENISVVMNSLTGLNPLHILLAFIMIIVGILFYSILAGLAGASVSKMEEITEGMKLFQFVMVAGAYLSMALCIMEIMGSSGGMLHNFCCLFPISSPFIVPAYLVIGKVSIGIALVSVVILSVLTVLLLSFTAKVYESMIFYQGKVLKLKDIIQIAKERNTGKEEKKS